MLRLLLKNTEGEKEITFNVTDALLSPLGLAVLTGAGFAKESDVKHIHVTYDVALDEDGIGTIKQSTLADELGVNVDDDIVICNDDSLKPNALILDNNGAIIGWSDKVTFAEGTSATEDATNKIITVQKDGDIQVTVAQGSGGTDDGDPKNRTCKIDFYCRLTDGATEITIEPNDFGGTFYVEADTLYRNQDGKDMAASLTFPKVKIESAFTLSMSPTGDPSTSRILGVAA